MVSKLSNKASNPNLFEAVQSLLPESEVERTYQTLFERSKSSEAFQEVDPESSEDSESSPYSFANRFLYDIALSAMNLTEQPDNVEDLSYLIGVYKNLYHFYYGTLEGAFTTGSDEKRGGLFSTSYKDHLWKENESGVKEAKPEATGYLFSLAEREASPVPYPLSFEPTGDMSLISQILYGDMDFISIEHEESSEGITEEDVKNSSSVFNKLSVDQLHQLSERVKQFDNDYSIIAFLSNSSVRQLAETLANLSEDQVARTDLSALIMSYKLMNMEPVSTPILKQYASSRENAWLFGGEIGLRETIYSLRADPEIEMMEAERLSQDDNNVETLSQNSSSKTSVSIPIKLSDESPQQSRFAQVPIAVIGKWYHPTYGQVEFTQQDFDQIKTNFENNTLGFEPPLSLGHENPNSDSIDGLPSEGIPKELYQEGNALYGFYHINDEQLYEDIKNKKYRYASPEYVKNFTCKETGEKVGAVLVGNALTNRPHMTRLPTVQALSDSGHKGMILDIQESETEKEDLSDSQESQEEESQEEEEVSSYDNQKPQEENDSLSKEESSYEDSKDSSLEDEGGGGNNDDNEVLDILYEDSMEEATNQTKTKSEEPQETEHLSNDSQQVEEDTTDKEPQSSQKEMSNNTSQQVTQTPNQGFEELKQLTQRIAQLENELNQRDQRIKTLEEDKKSREKEQRLSHIQSMNINQATKDKYKDLVENEKLSSEQFDEVVQLLSTAYEDTVQTLTQQHGTSTATEEENAESEERSSEGGFPNPYKEIIERNLSQARERKQN